MKIKIIPIKKCDECIYYTLWLKEQKSVCKFDKSVYRIIEDYNNIPDFCPLEDYK
jgi:hypothetical protein